MKVLHSARESARLPTNDLGEKRNGITSRVSHLSFGHQTTAVMDPARVSGENRRMEELQVGGFPFVDVGGND